MIRNLLKGRGLSSLNVQGILSSQEDKLEQRIKEFLEKRISLSLIILDAAELTVVTGRHDPLDCVLNRLYYPTLERYLEENHCARGNLLLMLGHINDLAFVGAMERLLKDEVNKEKLLEEIYSIWVDIVVLDIQLAKDLKIGCLEVAERCPYHPCRDNPCTFFNDQSGGGSIVLRIQDIHNEVFDPSSMLFIVSLLEDCIPKGTNVIIDLSHLSEVGEPVNLFLRRLSGSSLQFRLIDPKKFFYETQSHGSHHLAV